MRRSKSDDKRGSKSFLGQITNGARYSMTISHRALTEAEQFHVGVSPRLFALFWLFILLLHALCAAYFSAACYLYRYIMPISLGSNLRRYALRLTEKQYTYVAYAHAAFAVPHCIAILQMIVFSLANRKFVFESATATRIANPKLSAHTVHSKLFSSLKWSQLFSPKWVRMLNRKIFYWRKFFFGHTGLFGIGGTHFHTIYLLQEIVEISLQSTQAYRMSCWLPRKWMNRQYVAMLVFNCWSTMVIQRFTSHSLPLERFLEFTASLLTDLVAIIAVPVILAYPYFGMYAPDRQSFEKQLWYDDAWLINMVNESQIIIVTSVVDIGGRLVFSISLLMTFMLVKTLIKPVSTKVLTAEVKYATVPKSAAAPIAAEVIVEAVNDTVAPAPMPVNFETDLPFSTVLHNTTSLAAPTAGVSPPPAIKVPGTTSQAKTSRFAGPRYFAFQDRLVFWGRRAVILWGVTVLIAQLHADSLDSPGLCGLQVRPWFRSKPSCSLLNMDCHKLQMTGELSEVVRAMDEINEPMLAGIVFRHCPNLQMPPNLKSLPRLIGFKVHNSTITRWEKDAALTNTGHPYLTFMFMVNVNMTELPQGLQTNDFPKRLTDIEYSTTNLTTLPADLHTKWPAGMVLVLERSKFQTVPETLRYMRVSFLGLGENNFSVVPHELVSNPLAKSIWLSGNPIKDLPDKFSPSLTRLRLLNTKVTHESLPTWVTTKFLPANALYAGGTPLCKSIKAWKTAGNLSALGTTVATAYAKVTCADPKVPNDVSYYPATYEDAYNVVA